MFLPVFKDRQVSRFSCDLDRSPGCLARLILSVGCTFLSSWRRRTGSHVHLGLGCAWCGSLALLEFDFKDRVLVPEFAVYCGAVRD